MDISSDKLTESFRRRPGLRKGNFKREIESLIMTAQNNTIRTDYVKAKIYKTQQKSKCRLWEL